MDAADKGATIKRDYREHSGWKSGGLKLSCKSENKKKTRLSQVQKHIRIKQDNREVGPHTHTYSGAQKITENGRGTLGNEVSIHARSYYNQHSFSFSCIKLNSCYSAARNKSIFLVWDLCGRGGWLLTSEESELWQRRVGKHASRAVWRCRGIHHCRGRRAGEEGTLGGHKVWREKMLPRTWRSIFLLFSCSKYEGWSKGWTLSS